MTGKRLILTIHTESAEGTHELIEELEQIVEDIKGGYEKGSTKDKSIITRWEIKPKQ